MKKQNGNTVLAMCAILTIIACFAKVAGYITVSWWIVALPIVIGMILSIIFPLIFVFLLYFGMTKLTEFQPKRNRRW